MSEEIIKVLDALCEKFGIAADWTSANVIPHLEQLCRKYVNYEIATSVVWLIIGVICLFISKWMLKKAKEFSKDADWRYGNGCAYGCVGCVFGFGILLLVGIIVPICQVFDIVTCFTLPEKIIIEELKLIYSSMKG